MNKRTVLIFFCAAMLCVAGTATAQVLYGTLTGNVTDPSGAMIPGAKVEALNAGTGAVREATTDERGVFLFNNLQAGTYRVTVKATGFQAMALDKVQVSANDVRRADFAVQIAKTAETVEVSAQAIALQTDKGDVRSEIAKQEVTDLPYNGGQGRNFQSLLYLIPGAAVPGNGAREANSDAGNPARAQTLFMNGQSSTGNSTKLDGATNSYPWLPVNIAYVPPSDAIEAVNVVTNAFDAEQGAAGGAAVNIAIKSGTNDLHGVLFEYNQNNNMTAVNYFSHSSPLNKNVFNQYGFAVGGPVVIPKLIHGKNKLFWFFDWQGTKRNQYGQATNLTMPNDAWRKGDFSALNCPALGGTGPQNQCIYDPLTGNPDGTGRTVFPNNTIPAARIASASTNLAGLLPALTRPNAFTSNTDTYGFTYFHRNNYDVKMNYLPTEKIMVWGRYSSLPMDIFAPLVLGKAGGDAFNGGNPGHAGGRVQTAAIGFTYAITPTLFLDGNVGFTRQRIGADGDQQNGFYGLEVLKIPGTNGDSPNYKGVPGFQVAGMSNIGNTNTGSPFLFRDNQYTTAYNLGKVYGRHNLRFGFQYDHYALNHFQPQGGTFGTARGTFGFDGSLTEICNSAAANGSCASNPQINNGGPFNSWAQFLLGFPSRMGKITQFVNPNALRFSDWNFYARDQWQVTPKLTINYGLRWEYYPIFSHDHYGATRFDPGTKSFLIGCLGSTPCDTGATASKKGFAPRLGMAYRLNNKSVVRGGYGITVDPDNMRNQRNNYPSVLNQDYTPSFAFRFITSAGVAQSSLVTGLPAPSAPSITSGVITSACPPLTTSATCAGAVASPTTFLPSTSSGTFQKNIERGYIQTWNLFVEHEFSQSLVANVGYVGAHGVHTMMNVNINGAAPGTGVAGRQLYPYVTSDMNSYMAFGGTKYNALQTQVRKRFGGSFITVAYTYAKAMNNINGDNGDGTLWRAYPVSSSLNWARAGFDRPHTLQISDVVQLPFGHGHKWLNHGVAAHIFGGFQFATTLSRFSGTPFTVGSSTNANAGGQAQSAQQIKSNVAILGGHDANTPYFDGTAFTNPAANTIGNTGRNILRGPGFFNIDARISKDFAFFKDGKVKLQLLGEAFNLFNHPSFSNPQAGTFSTPTLNADGSVRTYNNFSVITGTVSSARQLQVGARLTF